MRRNTPLTVQDAGLLVLTFSDWLPYSVEVEHHELVYKLSSRLEILVHRWQFPTSGESD